LSQVQRDYEMWSSFSVVADDVAGYLTALKAYATGINGRVLSSSMSRTAEYRYGQVTLKVPVTSFDEANGRVVADVSEVVSERVEASDVTGTTVSLAEQKQKLEEEQLELELELETATETAERRRLEYRLEQIKTRLETLTTQVEAQEERVDYATINVMVADDADYFGGKSGGKVDVKDELERAWSVVWYLLQRVLVFLLWVIVFSILWLPPVFLVIWFKKMRSGSKES